MRSRGTWLMGAVSVVAGIAAITAPLAPADAQWVLVARKAAGRIHHMIEGQQGGRPGYDFASVLLEAPAEKVFDVALALARKNTALRVIMTDPGAYRLRVAEGDRSVTLHVVALNDEVSQLLIAGTAGPGEDSTTSRVVATALRVCEEMKRHCSVGN